MKTKRILYLTALLFFVQISMVSVAQFSKGNILVEGSVGNIRFTKDKIKYQQQANNDSKSENSSFSIGLYPTIGFFVSNNFVVGASLRLNFSSNKAIGFDETTAKKAYEDKSSSIELGILPFLRYYFPSANIKTRLYGEVGGGFSFSPSYTSTGENYSSNGDISSSYKDRYPKKPSTITGEAFVGLNHFLSENVALNAAIGYMYERRKVSYITEQTYSGTTNLSPETTGIISSNSFLWNVGFTMFIPCKKKK